ncbi:MAG: class III poly(R)-hydroxyalkanoic acid synthase subunit PhaC [Methylococcaceae bacterium]|nr:class III poly(R)-hydroxyalkanoic acid synthase subunit PhaC [Methylococcaceae bacterium]MCI0734625.1 class III poly(R)-hydroxyalkanoic acid synthase subunit PhaC [Methylococcaceae bacterium]
MEAIKITPEKALEEFQQFQANLAKGLKNLSEIGEIESGVTPREAVYQEDKMVLYHYQPSRGKQLNPTPLLIVYALVNRPYMADLQEDRSTIRGLMDAGQDVYLIDWGYPDQADKFLNLDDYLNGYIDRCVDFMRKRYDVGRINLLGICQGGTFSLCYSAMHPDKIANLVTMVTPVDFKTEDNVLSRWIQNIDVDKTADALGNLSGDMLNYTFLSLKPMRLTGQKYLDMVNILADPKQAKNFMRMEKWIFDSPDQAGQAWREFCTCFYKQNKLVEGGLKIGDYEVNLKNVTMPVLNVYATLDHLVPPAASKVLKKLISSEDYEEIEFPGGHIGIYVSGRAQKEIPPAIGKWLEARR